MIRDDDRKSRSSPDRLRFCDIAVLLADSLNQTSYQAHFCAVFEELYGIPFNMVDLPIAGECRVVEALLLLLDLPLGEFNRPELLRFLTHPSVSHATRKQKQGNGRTGALSWKSSTVSTAPITKALTSIRICSTGNRAFAALYWVPA